MASRSDRGEILEAVRVETYRGDLVVIREPTPDGDGPLRKRWFDGDPEGVHNIFIDEQPEADQVARIRRELEDLTRWVWTVEAEGRPVGLIQISGRGIASIAYYIAPDERGNGYAKDAARIVVEKAHGATGAILLLARILTTNPGSISIVKAQGFESHGNRPAGNNEVVEVWVRRL